MLFKIIAVDDEGNPTRVHTNDGFIQTAREFIPDKDGWMLDQLDPIDFPAILQGRDMAYLVDEVNRLRRELFHLKKQEDLLLKRVTT